MHFLIYSVCLSPLCLYTVYKWKSQNTLTKKPTPSSFLSLMPLQASPFADVHFRLYTPDLFKPDWDMPSSLLLFFLLRAALMSLSCTSGPLPTERRTHWLKDVTIATREKKQKKKKDALWGGRRREYSEMERDWEGVNNLKTERKSVIEGADRWRGSERASDGGERLRVFLSGRSHTGQNTDQLRLWQQKMSASDSVFFTLSLFISVSSVNFVSNNLTVCLWVSYAGGDSAPCVRTWSVECLSLLNLSHTQLPQIHTRTQTHLALTWILGDCVASTCRENVCNSM